MIRKSAQAVLPALSAPKRPAPSDKENLSELQRPAGHAGDRREPEPARAGRALFKGDRRPDESHAGAARGGADGAVRQFSAVLVDKLRLSLEPTKTSVAQLPNYIRRDWMTPDGRARIEVFPRGDRTTTKCWRNSPPPSARWRQATGAPITVVEAGQTIVRSFLKARFLAFVAIFAILYIAMRSVKDVALALGPLVLAGIMSLQAAQLLGMSLDFANIIALPLMFARRRRLPHLLSDRLAEGRGGHARVQPDARNLLSSLTTGIAFGSLCLSPPGHSRHGQAAGDIPLLHVAGRLHHRAGFPRPPPDLDDVGGSGSPPEGGARAGESDGARAARPEPSMRGPEGGRSGRTRPARSMATSR